MQNVIENSGILDSVLKVVNLYKSNRIIYTNCDVSIALCTNWFTQTLKREAMYVST